MTEAQAAELIGVLNWMCGWFVAYVCVWAFTTGFRLFGGRDD